MADMKKMQINMSIKSDYKEQLIAELLADEDIQKLLTSRNWDKKVIEENIVAFSDWLQQYKYCKNCTGLVMCDKKMKGYCLQLDEQFNEILTACHYQKEEQQQYAHQQNYILNDLSKKSLSNDLNKISLEREDDYYKGIVSLCRQWLKEKPLKGLYFVGKFGVGKTYLAACIANQLAKEGYKIAFVNMPNLCVDLKSNMTEKDYIENKLSKMKKAYLLVLDDIGAENTTAWFRDEILFPVLDYRMENGKRTIFTGNCDLKSLKKRLTISGYGQEDEVKAARIIERIQVLSKQVPLVGETRRSI